MSPDETTEWLHPADLRREVEATHDGKHRAAESKPRWDAWSLASIPLGILAVILLVANVMILGGR